MTENDRRAGIAMRKGETTYIAEKPCRHGHLIRRVTTHNCVACEKRQALQRRQEMRERYILKRYGLSWEAFEKRVQDQQGKCSLCPEIVSNDSDTAIDVNPDGTVRSLVCRGCSLLLRNIRRDRSRAKTLLEYIASDDPIST